MYYHTHIHLINFKGSYSVQTTLLAVRSMVEWVAQPVASGVAVHQPHLLSVAVEVVFAVTY